MAKKNRYWVYEHDQGGTLTLDLGEHDSYADALDAAGEYLQSTYRNDTLVWNNTVRIVDNDFNDGATIWMAGPVLPAGQEA